jgi:hypothetical protein
MERTIKHRFIAAMLLGAAISATPGRAEIELVQVATTNIDDYVARSSRAIVLPGDVILRSDTITVAVLSTSSRHDPTRAGQCVVFADQGGRATQPILSFKGGPGSTWVAPEAGKSVSVGVVRFHKEEKDWRAELTYRLRDGRPWVEVSTTVVNKNSEQTLELPIVDTLLALDAGDFGMVENDLTLVSKSGSAIAYVGLGLPAISRQGRLGWNVTFASEDPLPGVMRRVSTRVMSLGRNSTSILPMEASRDWHRDFKDRKSWFRIPPGQERVLTRRLMVGATKNQLVALLPAAREGSAKGAPAPTPAAEPTIIEEPAPVLAERPTAKRPRVTVAPAEPVATKEISGKLRGVTKEARARAPRRLEQELPDPLPMATSDEAPSLPVEADLPRPLPAVQSDNPLPKPSPVAKPKQVELPIDADLTPMIDAIEDLPPPIE